MATFHTLQTTEDAGRSRPSRGAAWDAAIAAGIDVTLLEHNLSLSVRERFRRFCDHLRYTERVQARTVHPSVREHLARRRLEAKLNALGVSPEQALGLDEHG